MKCGVVYRFKPHKKINGTLFYCFEYFSLLRKHTDAKFYVTNASPTDIELIRRIFQEKYNAPVEDIVPVKTVELYALQLDQTIVLDVDTFKFSKEFLTNTIHCFANEEHEMYRYKNDRVVTYYGSYPYQNYDVFSYIKLNFDIFKPLTQAGDGVFISTVDAPRVMTNQHKWMRQYKDKPIIFKQPNTGSGNIFDHIDTVHYVHKIRDTNNRIIPEAFFYGKTIIIEEETYSELDSIRWRFEDITQNGLGNYTLTEHDAIISACLQS